MKEKGNQGGKGEKRRDRKRRKNEEENGERQATSKTFTPAGKNTREPSHDFCLCSPSITFLEVQPGGIHDLKTRERNTYSLWGFSLKWGGSATSAGCEDMNPKAGLGALGSPPSPGPVRGRPAPTGAFVSLGSPLLPLGPLLPCSAKAPASSEMPNPHKLLKPDCFPHCLCFDVP